MIIARLGFLLVALTAAAAASAPPRAHQLHEAYTFSEYLAHFNKSYSNPKEYARRSQIFYANLKKILAHNEGRMDEDGKVVKGYVMGVNRFTDQEVHEVPMGYNKSHRAYRGGVEAGGVVTAMERRLGGAASYSVGVNSGLYCVILWSSCSLISLPVIFNHYFICSNRRTSKWKKYQTYLSL
jgi:cathepsin L